jgi:organic radical activating enzyme
MFYRRWLKKIFPSQGYLGIRLYPTNICDTGCRHCIEDSGMKNALYFQPSMAQAIVKEARRRRWDLSILITGGGEPLLCKNLEVIVQIFKSYERLSFFFINTSGFLKEEKERERRFRKIFSDKDLSLHIGLSYNLYHPSFPERFSNVAEALMAMHAKNFLMLRACVSSENAQETNRRIARDVEGLAKSVRGKYFCLPIGRSLPGKFNIEKLAYLLENEKYGSTQADKLGFEAEVCDHWYAIKTERGGLLIMVEHYSLIAGGRAFRLEETPYDNAYCPGLAYPYDFDEITVDANGFAYPEQCCHPDQIMCLGQIGKDSLGEIVLRKRNFREQITKLLLMDKRRFSWGSPEMCQACRQICSQKTICK